MKDKIWAPAFLVMTLIWLGPLEIFAANSYEFSFALKDYGLAQFVFGLAILLVLIMALTVLPSMLARIAKVVIFVLTLCCYIQTMFLNGHMQTFNNQEIVWDSKLKAINFCIWLFIFAIVSIAILKTQVGEKAEDYVAAFLTMIQLIALISLLFSTDILQEDKNGYLSTKNMNVLSGGRNVIVFLLDYYDGTYVEETFSKRPDLVDGLDGFVYYPNATSIHSRTYPSLPYLFSGEICYFDKEPNEYIKEAYEKWNLFDELNRSGVDVGYYGYDYFLSDSVKKNITNYEGKSLKLKYAKVCKYMLKMVLYRDMPYICKARFKYDIDDINDSVRIEETADSEVTQDKAFRVFNDTWFGESIDHDPLVVSKETNSAFRFYHLGGCHRDLSHPIEKGIESFEIVEEYLTQMRELGLYKDSTIIIMADHGKSGGGVISESLPHETAVPLMLVKGAGDDGIPMRTSDAPVSHTDYIPTVCYAFDLESSSFGVPIYEVTDNQRERYYYYTALETDEDGEVVLQEYRVVGDARDPKSYTYTGNSWDVEYSLNRVANR